MRQPAPDDQGYAPRSSDDGRHPSSRPPSTQFSQSSLPVSQTLPPLTAGPSPTVNHNFSDVSRVPSLQHAFTAPPSGSFHTPSYVYGPTASTWYNAPSSTIQSPHGYQETFLPYAPTTCAPRNPVYTSTATSQTPLPDIRPNSIVSDGQVDNSMALTIRKPMDIAKVEPQPTHVVGSQGRRGILPSAEGKVKVEAIGNAMAKKGSPVAKKNARGKWDCPYCKRDYLHMKHLKRHLLRHTGIRPYACGLCKDTFSRSDILKRHFQKCSQRRGNPSGENHLAHSRATKKKASEQEAIAAGINAMSTEQIAEVTSSFGPLALETPPVMNAPAPNFHPSFVEDPKSAAAQNFSQSNGTKKKNKQLSIRPPHSAKGSMGSMYDGASYSNGHVTPDSITTSGAATPFTFHHDQRSAQVSPDGPFNPALGMNGVSRPPTSQNFHNSILPQIVGQNDWRMSDYDSQNYQFYHSHEEFGNGQYHSGTNTPHHQFKTEPDPDHDPWNMKNGRS